eukprot:jgi/Astpho2/1392/e_gw1.00025.31.1_t
MSGSNQKMFQMVVAATQNLGIGLKGGMPWKLPGDMAYFKELTSRTIEPGKMNAVIMGRKTWESIPAKFRPLPGRVNVVLSRGEVAGIHSSRGALELLASPELREQVDHLFVIGGGQVYREAMASPRCGVIHFTQIQADLECDTFFPAIDPARWALWSAAPPCSEKGLTYAFLCYTAAGLEAPHLPPAVASQHEEKQYLDMVREVIATGHKREDRTGTGTLSRFGCQMRFNLRHSFPLLTTKRVFWRGVAEELLWFVRGCTDARQLQAKGIPIWDGHASRQHLDSVGLTDREEGDLGPVYGFQWRHFGAPYRGMHADYSGQGVDQLAECIHKIKTNPYDRRIVLTAWNPTALPEMALPPCHMFCQFFVADGELSCQMYQRSCDLGLGVPFNIASYALLTCLMAQVCGLRRGELVHVLGDTHVYLDHVNPLEEQLRRSPRPFPRLRINPDKTDIDSFLLADLELQDYEPHKKINMQMSV